MLKLFLLVAWVVLVLFVIAVLSGKSRGEAAGRATGGALQAIGCLAILVLLLVMAGFMLYLVGITPFRT